MFKRVNDILTQENIVFDKKTIAALTTKYFPDFRKILNELQRYATAGSIDSGILVDASTTMDELISAMRQKKFMEVRKWFARNADLDHQQLFRTFYDKAPDLFAGTSLPTIILCLAQYQHMSAVVVDQELNSVALAVEIMASAEWK
jgi:replication factor C small subunit